MDIRKECNKKITALLFLAGIFVFSFIFFAFVHPPVVYDMDDWLYIAWRRNAYPQWKGWNPCRIFPETFMAACSDFGIYILMPLFKLEYLRAISLSCALILSVTISIYAYLFCRMMIRAFKSEPVISGCLCVLFMTLHFAIFRSSRNYNRYLFWSKDLTCYYYYVMPCLMNTALVMFFISKGDRIAVSDKKKYSDMGVLLLMIYLSIFSDLFQTGILVGYTCAHLFTEGIKLLKDKNTKAAECVKNNSIFFVALIFWCISLVFEAAGGRASMAGEFSLNSSIESFAGVLKTLGKMPLAFMILFILVGLFVYIRDNKRDGITGSIVIKLFLAMVFNLVFLILLCAKVDGSYMRRSDVNYGIFIYLILISLVFAVYLIRKIPAVMIVFPVLMYILIMNVSNADKVFEPSNVGAVDEKTAYAISSDMLEQVLTAVSNGQDEIEMHVPVHKKGFENWPHSLTMGEDMAHALYSHGIVNRALTIKVIPDEHMNEKYGLPIDQELGF